jgi:hypothetical protein
MGQRQSTSNLGRAEVLDEEGTWALRQRAESLGRRRLPVRSLFSYGDLGEYVSPFLILHEEFHSDAFGHNAARVADSPSALPSSPP